MKLGLNTLQEKIQKLSISVLVSSNRLLLVAIVATFQMYDGFFFISDRFSETYIFRFGTRFGIYQCHYLVELVMSKIVWKNSVKKR